MSDHGGGPLELRAFLARDRETTVWKGWAEGGLGKKPKTQERREDDYLVVSQDLGLKWRSSQRHTNEDFEVKIRLYHNPLTGCEEWSKHVGLKCALPSLASLDSRGQQAFKQALTAPLLHLGPQLSPPEARILSEAAAIISDPSFDVRPRLLRVAKARRQLALGPKKVLKLVRQRQEGCQEPPEALTSGAPFRVVVEQAYFSVSRPLLEGPPLVQQHRSICVEGHGQESCLLWVLSRLALHSATARGLPYLIAGYPQYLETLLKQQA